MGRAVGIGACFLGAVFLGVAPLGAQTGAPFVVMPHGTGSVYVPLDPSGRPAFPPAGPAAPATPAAPAVPGGPSVPAPADWGSIVIDVVPGAATVYVDGERVGTAAELTASRRTIPLPPGPHRIEIALAGYQPVRATVEVTRRESYALQAALVPDPGASAGPTRGGGYFVVPGSRDRVDPPGGGGYQVVPRP